jgi:adenosylmethionine---8-amino-7-oxononanoate aminotransferase
MPAAVDCVPIQRASGCTLYAHSTINTVVDSNSDNGSRKAGGTTATSAAPAAATELIDGMSSWWACIHGYSHPHLNRAVLHQLQHSMSHIMLGGLTHAPAIQLATKLAALTGQDHVFFSDSGSVAVEVAMKLALQYWHAQSTSSNSTKRKCKFLTVRNGYHGDTFAAMSVCDPINGMHHMFRSVLMPQLFADAPLPSYADADEFDPAVHMRSLTDLLQQHSADIAAVILEPIVQGAGGMRFYAPQYLHHVRVLCDQYDVLLIADEIATGFGRTGKLFACDHANIRPDILCLGKALSGGYMSFAATLCTSKIASQLQQQQQQHGAGVLMHGPTFMGNPLACAVSLASLELLEDDNDNDSNTNSDSDNPILRTPWRVQVPAIQAQLERELAPCRESPHVRDVRVLGAIGVVEYREPFDLPRLQAAVLSEGVWLRPFGRLLYTMPPFIIRPHELRKITRAMVKLSRRKF